MKHAQITRRTFLKAAGTGATGLLVSSSMANEPLPKRPNLVYVFADQWRAEATGYAGNPDVKTPHLDRLAAESINLRNAVSGCPVCSPYRASLITGQYPLRHGVFLNDLTLSNEAVSIAQAYNAAGYDTGYIGKWHLAGHGRSAFIPRRFRQGFGFWKVLECTHNYNNSPYYGDEDLRLTWDGYDAIAQTHEAQRYIRDHATGRPFALFLSWGPPHAPYHTAPEKYRAMFDPETLSVRANVPEEYRDRTKKVLAGYYAHIAAIDECIGQLLDTIQEAHIDENTIFVFTSDHGDMLYSHGFQKKQQPWDESIRVPFLIRYPKRFGGHGRVLDMPINTPDIMPTLLGLCGIEVPETVEGTDFSSVLTGEKTPPNSPALITCPSPFGQWNRDKGGREYRGLRTDRYTYVRDLNGPWLLFDNETDPCQLTNLCNKAEYAAIRERLDKMLAAKLKERNDAFLSGWDYIRQWGYKVDASGTVPYTN